MNEPLIPLLNETRQNIFDCNLEKHTVVRVIVEVNIVWKR